MKENAPPPAVGGIPPVVLGTACCLTSAIGYTAVNVCLRFLTVTSDRLVVLFVKEAVTVVVVGPWMVWVLWRNRAARPSLKVLGILMLVGLATQLAANLPVLWSLSVVGLAVTIPCAQGFTLIAGSTLGWLVLRERIPLRSVVAMALMTGAVVLLSVGGDRVNTAIASSAEVATGLTWVVLAVLAACMAGVVYGILTVTIRRSMTGSVSPELLVVVITGMGLVSLAPIRLGTVGVEGLADIPLRDFGIMLAAGALNLIAFVAIVKGLAWTTVVHANVLNASQTAMAAVAGFLFFQEPPSLTLVLGVVLTVAGMILIKPPVEEEVPVEV